MYEVCRVQKLTTAELGERSVNFNPSYVILHILSYLDGFDDSFIDRLFEMVEITRDTDEVLNYAIIRLIVSPPNRLLHPLPMIYRVCVTRLH